MAPHKFQSITESQWKSGFPRHCCSQCSQDYDNPVHYVSLSWPTVIIDDLYIPECAVEIVKLAKTSTLERDYAMIHALAVYAELKLRGVRLN